VDFLPKVKLEVIVPAADVPGLITAISDAARSDKIGDGKIWVTQVDSLTRIRTGEEGDEAV
jgi:nitrogen regulatory protein P-II 1